MGSALSPGQSASFAGNPDDAGVQAALDVAYRDVLASFDYYLAHHNDGRPIVLAGHSQGSTWFVELLKDRFDGKPLADRLVAAYLPGEFIGPDTFHDLPTCTRSDQTGCVVSWATVAKGGKPHGRRGSPALAPDCTRSPAHTRTTPTCIHPLTWTSAPTHETGNSAQAVASGPFDGEFVAHWFAAWCDGGLLRIDDRIDRGIGSFHDWIGGNL